MGELWNHWFWVTLALGVLGSSYVGSESLSIDSAGQHLAQHGEEFPPGRGKGRALTFGIAENQEEDKVVEMLEIEEEEAEKGELEEVSVAVSVGVRRPNVATTPTD